MALQDGITRELSVGEVISKTFELYKNEFLNYLGLFAVVGVIIGILTTLIQRAIILPAPLPAGSTLQDFLNWAPGYYGSLAELLILTLAVTWMFYPLSLGGATKMASEEIAGEKLNVVASVKFVASRISRIWLVGFVVYIIVILGFVALFVPGLILAIMFSLVLPAIILENPGFSAMSRSRELVSHRWLKTLALIIIFGIIIGVSAAIAGAIGSLFGAAATVIGSVLAALYLPLIPILLTVYYYSNRARISIPQTNQVYVAPAAGPRPGMKFCPNCGAQIEASATFCSKCGAKQPT